MVHILEFSGEEEHRHYISGAKDRDSSVTSAKSKNVQCKGKAPVYIAIGWPLIFKLWNSTWAVSVHLDVQRQSGSFHDHYHPWNQAVLKPFRMFCFWWSLWFILCHENTYAGMTSGNCVWQLVWSVDNSKNQRGEVFELYRKKGRNAKVKVIIPKGNKGYDRFV